MKNIEKYIDDIADIIAHTQDENDEYACEYLYLCVFHKRCWGTTCSKCLFCNSKGISKWGMSEVVEK